MSQLRSTFTHSPGRAGLLRKVIRPFFRVALRLEVEGAERIPERGACVLVFNHLSNFDPHLLFTLVHRPDATGLVAAEYRSRPLARWLVEAGGGTWIRRGGGDRAALRTALALLEEGWLVGLAPEGRRSPTGVLSAGRPGAAFLALRADALVLPVAVTGTERLAVNLLRLRRTRVRVRVGEPFHPTGAGAERARYRLATAEIMDRIAALLPPEYRSPALEGSGGRHVLLRTDPEGASP